MFAGVLIILPVVALPIVQAYWLAALAYLFSGRWPSGVPTAWKTGNAEPWPTGQALREQRAEAAARRRDVRRGKGARVPAPEPEPEPVGEPQPAVAQGGRSSAAKRKRKRRR
jgi:hypothetical protein